MWCRFLVLWPGKEPAGADEEVPEEVCTMMFLYGFCAGIIAVMLVCIVIDVLRWFDDRRDEM